MDDFADPQWLRALVFGFAAAVAAAGSAGLFLAVIGHYSLALALVIGAVVFVGLAAASRPLFPLRGTVSRSASKICAVAAVAAVVLITVWNVSNAAQHVFINRDGGTYLNAGKWISAHGTLEVDPYEGAFAKTTAISANSPGMSVNGNHLDFTLEHMVPALLAEAQGIGGDSLMYALVPILGGVALLAFYLLARRVLRYPLAALGAMLTLAFLMPQVSFSRDSTTEIPVQVLLFTGVWLLCDSRTLRHRGTAFTAGLFLGLLQAMHIDGLAFLFGLPFICAAVWLRADPEDRRRATQSIAGCGLGAGLGVALGFFDVAERSSAYLGSLRVDVERLVAADVAAIVAAIVLAAVLRNWSREPIDLRDRFERVQKSAAFFVSEVVLIGGFGAWFVRPFVQTVRGRSNNVVAVVQAATQLTADPTRKYFEHAVGWASWYIGPLSLSLAIIAAAIATRALVRGELRVPTQIAALVIGPGAVLYLWRPSITPDQIWAMRRFLPAVFPILVLAAFGLLCYVADSDYLGWDELRRFGVLLVGVATVAYPVYTILNLSQMTEQRGYPAMVQDVCDLVGRTGAVVVPQETNGTMWIYGPQTLRGFCDVPVAVAYSGERAAAISRVTVGALDGPTLRELALDWASRGRKLYMVANSPRTIMKLFPGVRVKLSRAAANPYLLVPTLVEHPSDYKLDRFRVAVAAVPLPVR
jgi:hypothetical protein